LVALVVALHTYDVLISDHVSYMFIYSHVLSIQCDILLHIYIYLYLLDFRYM